MTTTFRHMGATAHSLSGLSAAALLALAVSLSADGAWAQAAGTPATPPAAAAPAAPAAADGPYVFTSPPSAQANRVYSVNVRTGEVNACQFERPEGSVIGVTKCFPRDASATAGAPAAYDIVTTRYSGETGIFRVNTQTGQMSVCYVRDMPKEGGGVEPAVVCTPAAR